MDGYSVEQHVQMIKLFYQNGCSVRATFRALRKFYGRHTRPTERTIRSVVDKFVSTGSVNAKTTLTRRRNARSAENIAAVRENVQENPRQSISRLSQELGLSQTTTWRILHCDLGLHMTNMKPLNKNTLLKVVILGDEGVGKSCLTNRFVSNRYENNFRTIGVEYMNKDIEVDGKKYTLQLWDTAGHERFMALRTQFYRGSDVCLLCYAVNDHDSFKRLKLWRDELLHYGDIKGDKFPFIVVGNKNDVDTQSRQVTPDEVKQWCDEFQIASFIETSSKTVTNVMEAFMLAVRGSFPLDIPFQST